MIYKIKQFLLDFLRGYGGVLGGARDPGWYVFRNKHIKKQCPFCGTTKRLELHHIVPFSDNSSLELEPDNVETACRDCHWKFCHLLSWQSSNPNLKQDLIAWQIKVKNRV